MHKSWLSPCFIYFVATLFALSTLLPYTVKGESLQTKQKTHIEGWPLGSFSIAPELTLLGVYDSNIFATRDDEVSDRFFILVPSLDIKSTWANHKLEISTGAELIRFDENSSEDTDDYWINLSGRYDLSSDNNLFGGFAISQEHEDRGTPDESAGSEPTTYLSSSAHLGTEITFRKFRFRLGGTYQQLDFEDVSATPFSVNNDDRDRSLYGLGIRANYLLNDRHTPFMQLIYDKRRYDDHIDDAGFRRDSEGYRTAVGLKSEMGTVATEFLLGSFWQDYYDSRFETTRGMDLGATVTWTPRPGTKIIANLERSINETTLTGASGYIETAVELKLIQQLGYQLAFSGQVGLSYDAYQGIDRDDDYLDAGFGFKYDLTRQLYIATNYRFSQRNSNTSPAGEVDGNDYYRHQLFLSLGARLYPVKRSPLGAFKSLFLTSDDSVTGPEGFYFGTSVGQSSLSVISSEQRNDGSSYSELGNQGSVITGFAGYGVSLKRWYFGLELEIDTSENDIDHFKDKSTSRSFSFNRDDSYGASARLGYVLANGALLYSRAGLVKSRFKVDYSLNNSPATAISSDRTVSGIRYGIGVDIPITEQLYGRLESTYTNYQSFYASSTDFNDHLNPAETQINLGLSWFFDKQQTAKLRLTPDLYQGFYSGVMVGYGGLTSEINGLHQDGGSNPGTYPYNSDFGNHGFNSGLFAGYGFQIDKLYLGAELDASISDIEWQRIRTTSGGGRKFAVEKKESYSISARCGYLFGNGTLSYLRAGLVRSKFNTEYIKGANPANHVDRNDYLHGTRVGAGFELPMTTKSFVRIEYSYTDYEKLRLKTAHSLPDDLSFNTTDNQVWIGFGFRF